MYGIIFADTKSFLENFYYILENKDLILRCIDRANIVLFSYEINLCEFCFINKAKLKYKCQKCYFENSKDIKKFYFLVNYR